MSSTLLNLIVLRSAQLEASLAFYQAIGVNFVQEQHGNGPVHYASESDGLVLEIYPGEQGQAPDRSQSGAVMLGFRVNSIEETLEALQPLNTFIITQPRSSAWGKRCVVQDPDGRAIELNEPPEKA